MDVVHKVLGEIWEERDEVRKNIRAIIRMKYVEGNH